jgi:hypothetical protein
MEAMAESHVPEPLARTVLARAIQLDDVRGVVYTADELRSLAGEVGVSSAAIDQALEELVTPAESCGQAQGGRFWWRSAALAGGVLGAATGVVELTTHLLVNPLAMGGLLMLSGGLAAIADYRRPGRAFLGHQKQNAVLWMLYAGGWSLVTAVGGAEPLTAFVMSRTAVLGFVLSSAFGAVVAGMHAWRSRSGSTGFTTNAVPLRTRVVRRLSAWNDGRVARSVTPVAATPSTSS